LLCVGLRGPDFLEVAPFEALIIPSPGQYIVDSASLESDFVATVRVSNISPEEKNTRAWVACVYKKEHVEEHWSFREVSDETANTL
jgi:hypothetical protein